MPDALAAAGTMLAAFLLVAAIVTAIAPSIGDQFGELRRAPRTACAKPPTCSPIRRSTSARREIQDRVDEGIAKLRENSGPLARGLSSGAVILGEVLTGLLVALLLTFFFLKDGERMWGYLLRFTGRGREHADELGTRVYAALAGYIRGIALVGLADAILIGLALLIIGVPLVVPIMVITFFAAFVPLIGAFLAGLVAVLIALVSGGLLDAALVLGAIILVQQVEGPPALSGADGPTVNLHPAVIVIALAAGGILGGIVGVFLAVPVAGIVSVVLDYVRPSHRPSRRSSTPVRGGGYGLKTPRGSSRSASASKSAVRS